MHSLYTHACRLVLSVLDSLFVREINLILNSKHVKLSQHLSPSSFVLEYVLLLWEAKEHNSVDHNMVCLKRPIQPSS
jgi:hypothetical protein